MEIINMISAGFAGIIIGLSFGYVYGHNKGYGQSNKWHERLNKLYNKQS